MNVGGHAIQSGGVENDGIESIGNPLPPHSKCCVRHAQTKPQAPPRRRLTPDLWHLLKGELAFMKNAPTLALLLLASCVFAQQPAKNAPAAKAPTKAHHKSEAAVSALLERAERARKTGDLPAAVKLYKQAIAAAPENESPHQGLSYAVYLTEQNRLKAEAQAGDPDKKPDPIDLSKKTQAASQLKLVEIYRPLVAAHPKVPAYQLQLAYAEHRTDGKLQPEIERIAAAYPRYAAGLAALAGTAGPTGDMKKQREYLRKACEAAPTNDQYAYEYLSTFKDGDQKEYHRLIEQFVARFPKGQFVGNALNDAAENAITPEDRQTWLERAANLPGTYYVADLLELYARTDVRKAAEVAQKKLGEAQKDPKASAELKELRQTSDYYGALAHAQDLLKAGQLDEAKATLDKATVPDAEFHPDEFPKTQLMAEVLTAQGKPQDGYKYLLDDRQIIADVDLQTLAFKLGAQIGKTEVQVQEDIISADLARATQPDDFELETLKGDAKIKLSSLRGKYVLVNGWHPT
jgi:soluble cytochrome b562